MLTNNDIYFNVTGREITEEYRAKWLHMHFAFNPLKTLELYTDSSTIYLISANVTAIDYHFKLIKNHGCLFLSLGIIDLTFERLLLFKSHKIS